MRTQNGLGLLVLASILGWAVLPAAAQTAPLAAAEVAYTQNFDTLANMGATNPATTLPLGWHLYESAGDTNYRAGTGSAATGDTYSWGATAPATDRAFGTLQSGGNPIAVGAGFTNSTGAAIGSVSVHYTGEQWRLGATGRADRLDFQYSLDATSLSTGTWLDVDPLDFSSPDTGVTGMAGARDGNISTERTVIPDVVISLTVSAGATFWIRWNDFDVMPGADDGLGVDDFSLTPHGLVPTGNALFDVFFDANGNGTHDAGESGIPGWGVALDGGASQNTAADGSTAFNNLTIMPHAVTNTPPAAAGTWTAVFPATITPTAGTTTTYHVAVTCACPDDGDLCTSIPVCNAGACPAPMLMVCDDTNVCTDDSCTAGVCGHVPNTLACSDGDTTTRNDVCGAGTCAGTSYSCTPDTCEATSVPNGVDCTITYSSAATLCGASGSCDHCSGTTASCVATTCPVDGGIDAAVVPDAGTDAAVLPDAGTDAAVLPDAGTDAAVVAVDAGMDAAVATVDASTDDAGLDAGAADDAGLDAAVSVDAGVASDTGVHVDGGPDSGARDASALDGSLRPDAATVTPPPVAASCGCTTSTRTTPPALWLGLLGLVILARRRRK